MSRPLSLMDIDAPAQPPTPFSAPDPQWWLTHLTKRMDDRRSHLALLRAYLCGDAPLPDGADNCRKAYQLFQRKARTNFAELITDAVSERMQVAGFVVGDSLSDDDDARRLWKANHLPVWSSDVHRNMLALGHGYVSVQPGPDGVEILHERPEQVIVEHDPERPDRRRAALKAWRDNVAGSDFAVLHLPGIAYWWYRSTTRIQGKPEPILTYSGGWQPLLARSTGIDVVPIIPFTNRDGRGEYETHLDVLDRINWGVLQRLVIIAMQAYRQRATKGDLPEVDEDGNTIDYGALLEPGPGALWRLPEGVELWESGQTDLTGVLEGVKADLRDLAAVTRTPINSLIPEGANQSAEGAAAAREGLVFKTGDRITRAQAAWAEVMALALMLDRDASELLDVEVQFAPPERQSLAERADALTKLRDDLPWRARMTDVMGYDGDRVDRMAAERAEDLLLAGLAAPAAPAVTPVQPRAALPAAEPAAAELVEVEQVQAAP